MAKELERLLLFINILCSVAYIATVRILPRSSLEDFNTRMFH
jgi:hypothetical protein